MYEDIDSFRVSVLRLVVVALWAVDLVFAMDSVASKLASVNDIFLNASSSAFAMLGLRSLYFVMESLVQSFHMPLGDVQQMSDICLTYV